jgi:hypothetical protein
MFATSGITIPHSIARLGSAIWAAKRRTLASRNAITPRLKISLSPSRDRRGECLKRFLFNMRGLTPGWRSHSPWPSLLTLGSLQLPLLALPIRGSWAVGARNGCVLRMGERPRSWLRAMAFAAKPPWQVYNRPEHGFLPLLAAPALGGASSLSAAMNQVWTTHRGISWIVVLYSHAVRNLPCLLGCAWRRASTRGSASASSRHLVRSRPASADPRLVGSNGTERKPCWRRQFVIGAQHHSAGRCSEAHTDRLIQTDMSELHGVGSKDRSPRRAGRQGSHPPASRTKPET